MIEGILKIAEVAKEAAAEIEQCQMSFGTIEDMRELLNSVASDVTGDEISSAAGEDFSAAQEIDIATAEKVSNLALDARSTYFKGGHSFETDDRGTIYKKDGEFIPNVEYASNGGRYKVDETGNVETIQEGYQSSYRERLDHTPKTSERGEWTGKRGESKYMPNIEHEKGNVVAVKLSEYGLDGITYQDAVQDFTECTEESVEIEMTDAMMSNEKKGIVGNFEKADTELAKKWNAEAKDGKTDWIARDIADYRSVNKMTWHECVNKKTCQLVSREIHEFFTHLGGRSEYKKSLMQDFGGGFDD